MPVYVCQVRQNLLSALQKSEIAEAITQIHCEQTGAPRLFVHVFFLDQPDSADSGAVDAQLHGSIRSGRSDEIKATMKSLMSAAISRVSGLSPERISAALSDTPASWVMEGGAVFPEPGEEAEWLEKHGAKLGQKLGVGP